MDRVDQSRIGRPRAGFATARPRTKSNRLQTIKSGDSAHEEAQMRLEVS